MPVAFLFPGQGSQRVGMGQALATAYPTIRTEYFERADEVLGFPLTRLCFEGPEDALVRTENQQPAIYLVSVAIAAVLREAGIVPDAVAGHSLGEYSALTAAGAIDFEEGLRLTRRRGELMAEVAERTGGIMAAVLGLPLEDVQAACREAAELGVAEVANENSPVQTVISGEEEAVRRAMQLVKERGAQRVVELAVSAPFHCSLMAPLAESFGAVLARAEVRDASVPVVANVNAQEEQTAGDIRRNLVSQLASPVRWTASMQHLLAAGYDTFVEVGPGKVLTGLLRAIDRGVKCYPTAEPPGIQAAIEGIRAG